MQRESHLSHFNMKVQGVQASKAMMDALLECVVENSLHLPDVCTLRLHDADFHWLDADLFVEGHKVEVSAGEGTGTLTPIFHGEVVALEMDLAAHGVPTLTVRCYDRSHRLHRGRVSRAFVNMKDSDIVKQVGQEVGLSVHADSTPLVHDWVLQNNQSNWEFLTERAARNGFRLYVTGERNLHFAQVKDGGEKVVELDWGKTLRSFRPRVSASTQVDEVIVRGWDPGSKQPIVGVCKRPSGTPQLSGGKAGGEIAHTAFGAAKMIVVDRPVQSQTEAETLARSICDDIGGAFLEADGLCYGQPRLKPNMQVQINNIGKRFSGKYYVTSTTHTYTPAEGYATVFAVSGKRAANLLTLLEGDELSKRTALGGNIVIGVVTANRDPEGMGRVKVMYPWLTEEHTSFWARTASQMAGSGRGMFNLPEIGDEVLVAFEHGDVSRPYVIGQLWNGKDALPGLHGNPTLGGGSEVNRRGFHSRIGHKLNFDDTGGLGNVTVQTANGHIIAVDDANHKVEITTTGGHKFVLDDQNQMIMAMTTSGHTINMSDAASAITMRDNAGDMLTMSMGNVSVTALQMLTLAAPLTNIAGALSVSITGRLITEVAGILNTHAAGIKTSIAGKMLTNVLGGLMVNVDAVQIKLNCDKPSGPESPDSSEGDDGSSGEGDGEGGDSDSDYSPDDDAADDGGEDSGEESSGDDSGSDNPNDDNSNTSNADNNQNNNNKPDQTNSTPPNDSSTNNEPPKDQDQKNPPKNVSADKNPSSTSALDAEAQRLKDQEDQLLKDHPELQKALNDSQNANQVAPPNPADDPSVWDRTKRILGEGAKGSAINGTIGAGVGATIGGMGGTLVLPGGGTVVGAGGGAAAGGLWGVISGFGVGATCEGVRQGARAWGYDATDAARISAGCSYGLGYLTPYGFGGRVRQLVTDGVETVAGYKIDSPDPGW